MAKLPKVQTEATLLRFNVSPNQLLEEYAIWTLELPTLFRDALWQFKTDVQSRLKSMGKGENIYIPSRQLNNALMAMFPTLVHGFEDVGKKPLSTPCVAIVQSSESFQIPDPENIRHVIREWAQLWLERSYITENIPEDERATLRSKLLAILNKPIQDWKWRRFSTNQLLSSFDPKQSLNYTALPSIFAALVHGKTSTVHGRHIQWRKVQDSESQKLSVVGFVNQRPIRVAHDIHEYKMNKSGEGYFAYKLQFRLQTQAGRNEPWLFVSLHEQRYAHESLTHANDRRRVAMLTAANRARLDDDLTDLALIKLRASDMSKNDSETNFEWNHEIARLLSRIGATALASPNDIFNAPQSYWRAPQHTTQLRDEYYIIHAEGYGYGDNEDGHQLEAGFSMTDSAAVFDEIISNHLPMLQIDVPLVPDEVPTPSGTRKPLALKDYSAWHTPPAMKAFEPGLEEERKAERQTRYEKQRYKYQQIVKAAISRALRSKDMLIAVLWNNEDTRDGVCRALEEAFLLNPGDSYPSNVKVMDCFVGQQLLDSLILNGTKYEKAHHKRMVEWRAFLKENIPAHPNRLAIIETFGRRKSWGIKGVARDACGREGITSQMVETIRMKDGSYVGGPGSHEHRANSVAHEVTLRHIGALLGDPQEVYQAAGINEPKLEVLAFFVRSTKTNIKYPVAVKLAHDGAFEVMLPGQKQWMLYRDAAPALARIFGGEWPNVVYTGVKRKIHDERRLSSALWHDKSQLSGFVLNVLKSLTYPTLALIEADNWRNFDVWPQLTNQNLHQQFNILNFSLIDRTYQRNDPRFSNLLGVIRIRTNLETPQYLTNTRQEFTKLAGFLDFQTGNLLHYFSIGRQLVTSRGQTLPSTRYATMFDGTGAGIAYKYPQVVEFVPFFVREDYANLEGLKKLCRVPHYLRISPAWPQGNIVLPYPMHLAQNLIEDQLCILAMED